MWKSGSPRLVSSPQRKTISMDQTSERDSQDGPAAKKGRIAGAICPGRYAEA